MLPFTASFRPIAVIAILGLSGTALMAQPGRWGGPDWDGESAWHDASSRRAPALEGKVEVARFRAGDSAGLGAGVIAVGPMADETAGDDARLSATFEAAVEDRLIHVGYAPAASGVSDGHLVEVRVVRSEAVPAEEKRNPLSGTMTVGVSNHGPMLGMALRYDGTKPRKALLSTRLETRIRDRASGALLWEGRAEMYSRAGDAKWDDQAIAGRLARALFDGFPEQVGEQTLKR